jgi:hypothetical protein
MQRVLELALLHVGPRLIEERAEQRARELLAQRRLRMIPRESR